MKKSFKLSATIITLNEEKDLPRALESLRDLVDEIILVDSGSTDKTLQIARKYGAKIYKRKFDNYANQKNFAASKASGEWILSLDADEEIPPQLEQEIKRVIRNEKFAAFSMPRKNIILGKFIKHARWQPELDRHVWLWQKGKGRWMGQVHEELEVDGPVGRLKQAKIHHQYETVHEFLDMINRYSEIEAEEKVKKGTRFSLIKLIYQTKYNFLVRFIYRLGFLDGLHGFALSYLMAFYHFTLWVKIWEKQK